MSVDGKNLLVGTHEGEIYEFLSKEKIALGSRFTKFNSIVKSHIKEDDKDKSQLKGLCFNPAENDIYYTCGDDSTLRVWSLS